MARKAKRARSSGGNRSPKRAHKTRTGSSVARTYTRVNTPTRLADLTPRSLSARSRSLQVLSDLRRDPSLTFSQAAENRGVDPSTIHKYLRSALRKDDSGRVVARPSDRFREVTFIPSTRPDERIPVPTKNNKERQV